MLKADDRKKIGERLNFGTGPWRGASAARYHLGSLLQRSSLFAALLLVFVTRTAAAAPTVVLDDPLTAPSGAGETVTGGTFSSAGWTRDSFSSKIVFDLGAPITAGRVVFEMNGVDGLDQGMGGTFVCRSIFAAVDNNGSGNIDDPGNESVQYLWAWAMEETDYCNGGPGGLDRTDRMKLLVHTTGATEPGEPMSDPLTWDITRFYTYEIGWDQNHAWLHRDGAVVLDIAYPSAPIVMNMRYLFLGTVNRYDAGVKNATYRNLVVYDDGGPPPSDAGAAPSEAGADGGTTCLSAGPLSPQSGSGASAVLSVPYSICGGASAFRVVQIWVGDRVAAGVPAVSAGYEAGLLSLGGSTDSCAPGEQKTLQSALGSLDCAKTTVSDSGDVRTVDWALAFNPQSFGGLHHVFVDAKGGSGSPEPRLGWTDLGTFTVVSSGADAATGFEAGYVDGGGRGDNRGATSRGSTVAGDSGCGCRLPAEPTGPGAPVAALALLAWAVRRRRRAPGALATG